MTKPRDYDLPPLLSRRIATMTDLVALARSRVDSTQGTHWDGCERDHRECLVQRMADEIERLRALLREARNKVSGPTTPESAATWVRRGSETA